MSRVYIQSYSLITGGRYYDKSISDIFAEVFLRAWDNAGNPEIDMIYIASAFSELVSEQLILPSYLCEYVNLEDTPCVRIEMGDGSSGHAILEAYKAVKSGECSTVMIIGVEKVHDVVSYRLSKFLGMMCNSDYEYFFGITPAALAALIMREYMIKYEYSYEDLAEWIVKMHERGSNNPYAYMRKKAKIKDVVSSEVISDPLRLYDMAPLIDGAAAIVVSNRPNKTDGVIEINCVVSSSCNESFNEKEDLTLLKSTIRARERLSKKVEFKDIGVLEVHDTYSILGILAVESLGFIKRGETPRLMKKESPDSELKVAINPSGGLKCMGNPVGASGMYQTVCAVMELLNVQPFTNIKSEYALIQDMAGIDRSTVLTLLKRVS